MLSGKADIVVVNLDPNYPQESIDAMTAGLRDIRMINVVKPMVPINSVLRRMAEGQKVGMFEQWRTFRELEKLVCSALTTANERPTKQLIVLVPPYVPRSELEARLKKIMQADSVVCTGSD